MTVTSIVPSRRTDPAFRPTVLIVASSSVRDTVEFLQLLSQVGGQKPSRVEARLWEESLASLESAVSAVHEIEKICANGQGPVLLPASLDDIDRRLLDHCGQVGVALFYKRPEFYLLDAITEGEGPERALQTWCRSVRRMLDFVHAEPERSALFDSEAALANVSAFSRTCQVRFGLDDVHADPGTPRISESRTELHKLIALQMVAESDEAKELLGRLQAVGELRIPAAGGLTVNFNRALNELRKLADAEQAREESALILSHLHEVQRELETNYLQLRETEKQLAYEKQAVEELLRRRKFALAKIKRLQQELSEERTKVRRKDAQLKKAKRELKEVQATLAGIRQSRSWRLTRPLRTINALLKRRR